MDLDEILLDAEDRMIKCVADYDAHLKSVRTGQASTEMVEHVHVNIPEYGGEVPLKQVAMVAKKDLRVVVIKPFNPKTIKDVEKGLFAANLGLTPQSDGKVVRMVFPPLTEETRKKTIKTIKDRMEQHKVTLRNVRHEAVKGVKDLKGKVSEDEQKRGDDEINELIKKYEAQLETHFDKKSKEIMTV